MSRSASAAATSASRLMRATSCRPMLVMYSFLSRTSLIVKLMTSSPILLISSAHVDRMRSPTISGSLTICSTVSCPMIPRRWPSITRRIKASRCSGRLVRNCSAAVRIDSLSFFTLICATASTVTATPCFVYRFCCGATSNASPEKLLLRKLFPLLHVRDSLLVALDDDLSPLLDGFALIGARARAAPNSRQGKNDFAGPVLADRHADGPHRTLHAVVFAFHRCVSRIHEFHHEAEDDPSSGQACERGKQKAEHSKQVRMPRE